MADPLTMTAVAMSSIAAAGSIAQGFSQKNQLRAQASAAELDAKYSQLRALQIGAIREEEMADVISSVNLLRSGRGLNLDSATGRALRAEARRRGSEAKRQDVSNEILNRNSLSAKAKGLRSASGVAPWIGFANAAGDISDAVGTFRGRKKNAAADS